MIIQALAFYLFAGVLILSALMVITVRNPVHSVLFLILAFFNAAGLFVLLGAEFIALILVIVYVGAVAVLFLFVVMMLDISFADLRKGAMQFVPLGICVGGVLFSELVFVYAGWQIAPSHNMQDYKRIVQTNTVDLGAVLYTDYFLPFQLAGLILFVAMVGAIVLTHRTRPGVRRQSVADQQRRRPEDVLEIQKIASRTGV